MIKLVFEIGLVIAADSDLYVGEGDGLLGRESHAGVGTAEFRDDAETVEQIGRAHV